MEAESNAKTSRLRGRELASAVIAAGAVASGFLFGVFTGVWQFLTALFGLVLLGWIFTGIVLAISDAKRWKWRAPLPLAIGVLGLLGQILAIGLGGDLGRALKRQDLPAYQRFVDSLLAQSPLIRGDVSGYPRPAAIADCCYRVMAIDDSSGMTTVFFFTDGGFPVRHSGLLYHEGDSVPLHPRKLHGWRPIGMIEPHWWWFGD
jgi:hypothetical protein